MSIHDLVEKNECWYWNLASSLRFNTKAAALKTANACGYKHLCFFGKHELTNEMIYNAAQFLLRYISNWKTRFTWRFKIWRLTQKVQEFREVFSDKQRNTTTYYVLICNVIYCFTHLLEDILIDPLQYGCSLNKDDLLPLIINSSQFSIIL